MAFIVNGWIAGLPLIVAVLIIRRVAGGIPPRVMQATTGLLLIATVFVALAPQATPQTGQTIAIPEEATPQRDHLASIWISIAIVLIARDLFGALWLRRERRTWTRATFDGGEILTAPHGTPMTIGLLKPVVFIPRRVLEMAPECARAIVLHERDHARFRDPLINLTVRLLRILCWPVLPLLVFERFVRVFAEEAADRAALRAAHAIDYAQSLAQVAAWSVTSPAAAMALTAGSLEARILRILRPARLSTPTALSAALVLGTSIFVSINSPAAVIARSRADVIRERIADATGAMVIAEVRPTEPAPKPKRIRSSPLMVEPLPLRTSGVLAESFRPASPPIVNEEQPRAPVIRRVQQTDPPPVVIRNVIRIVN